MKRGELLIVEDRFKLKRVGLILAPDFPVLDGWKNIEEIARVVTPSGTEIEVVAQFRVAHFKLARSLSAQHYEHSWRVIISLPGRQKAEVPVGSKVFVSADVMNAVLGQRSGGLAQVGEAPGDAESTEEQGQSNAEAIRSIDEV